MLGRHWSCLRVHRIDVLIVSLLILIPLLLIWISIILLRRRILSKLILRSNLRLHILLLTIRLLNRILPIWIKLLLSWLRIALGLNWRLQLEGRLLERRLLNWRLLNWGDRLRRNRILCLHRRLNWLRRLCRLLNWWCALRFSSKNVKVNNIS